VSATEITVIGNVANSPSRNRTQNGAVTNFRMAATERRYDSATGDFIDGSTFWVDVECWGDLGGNVSHSVSKGDPVVVVGRIRTHEWESENSRRSRPQIRAEAVGPNLARGIADFKRPTRSTPAESPESPAAVEETNDEQAPAAEVMGAGGDYDGGSRALYGQDSDLVREPAHV
jgi:single stranded DNA-binding protein